VRVFYVCVLCVRWADPPSKEPYRLCVESIYLWLCIPYGPWPFFQFLNPYTVGWFPWTGDQPVLRPIPTHTATQAQNKRMQTSMPRVGFESTIPAFERAALDRAATVIGVYRLRNWKIGQGPQGL
jgi:hypothetical protein